MRRSGGSRPRYLRLRLRRAHELERMVEEQKQETEQQKKKYKKLERKVKRMGSRDNVKYSVMNQHQMEFNIKMKENQDKNLMNNVFKGEVPEDLAKIVENGKK